VTDFRALIEALGGAEVRFVIVGGVAATLHGSARLTQDVDVVYSRDAANLARLARALAPLEPYLRGAPPGLPFRLDEPTPAAGLNFTLKTSVGDIDLPGEIAGAGGYDALLPHTVEVQLYGARCKCLDLPTLIASKVAAGRPKDLETIAELRALLDEQSPQS
jgi:predicted nucleotidyltransferase